MPKDVYKRQGIVYGSGLVLVLISMVVALLGVAVLITYSLQTGIILLVIAFLISPYGLPMAAIWLLDVRAVLRQFLLLLAFLVQGAHLGGGDGHVIVVRLDAVSYTHLLRNEVPSSIQF